MALSMHLQRINFPGMKTIVALIIGLLPFYAWAQIDSLEGTSPDSLPNISIPLDSLSAALAPADSLSPSDTTKTDPVADARRKRQEELKAQSDFKSKVNYTARDSSVLDAVNQILYLYGAVNVKYEDVDLTAEEVSIDFTTQTLFAKGVEDSLGNLIGAPIFKQGEQQFDAREMSYNFNTEKGVIKGARTNQGEGDVLADVAKRQPDGSIHIKGGKYTTCDLDHPHYYIESRKLKLIPGKQVISGPLNLVIEDFPIPIVIPFGFFPTNTNKRQRNGIVLPQYGEQNDRGFFLRGLGYYRAINDYMDMLVDGDIYTKGGWALRLASKYNVRYKYNGGFSAEYSIQQFGEKTEEFTDPDFQRIQGWRLTWRHSQPINPTTRFSANVNLSNSKYLERLSGNPNDVLTNTLNSSVSFSKSFAPFTLSVSLNHSQDVKNNTVNLTLPSANLQMSRQTPFKRIKGKGLEWLSQLGITYGLQATNQLSNIQDSIFFPILINPGGTTDIFNPTDSTTETFDNSSFYRRGIQHRSAATTNIKLLKYITVPLNFNFREYWYFEQEKQVYNRTEDEIETIRVPGFSTARDFNFSVNANTTLFSFYQFTKSKKGIVIRHQFIPNIGYSLNPDFSAEKYGFYGTVQTDREGNTRRYNRFQNGVFGSPSAGESQSLNFGISNVFEMKYKKRESFEEDWDETKDPYERVRLLDNLSINSGYNFAADSFQLSPFSLSARTTLFNRKLNINASGAIDPYALGFASDTDTVGRRVNRFEWNETGRIGRLTRAQISFNTGFSSKKTKKKQRSEGFDEIEYQAVRDNLTEYVDFDVPWSARINYNLQYTKTNALAPTITQTLRLNGDFSLTPKWKITYSSGYDFTQKEVTLTRFSIIRDLHCWEMSFQVTPFGSQQSYMFAINVRSSTLKDLRLTKQSRWQDRAPF